jgi:hypothetical protein
MWDFNVMLITLTNAPPAGDHPMTGIDVSDRNRPAEKDRALREAEVVTLPQAGQLENPDCRVSIIDIESQVLLSKYADSYIGFQNGDTPRFILYFWECQEYGDTWEKMQLTSNQTSAYLGK